MVTTPRAVVIHDGQIRLPDDMLEKSGINKSGGVVMLDQRETGEIVVRAPGESDKRTSRILDAFSTDLPEPDADHDSDEYQLWLVQSTAGILHEYSHDILMPTDIPDEELPAYWRQLAEDTIAEDVLRSMSKGEAHEDDVH